MKIYVEDDPGAAGRGRPGWRQREDSGPPSTRIPARYLKPAERPRVVRQPRGGSSEALDE